MYVCQLVDEGRAASSHIGIRSGRESTEAVFFFESGVGSKPFSHCDGLEHRQLGRHIIL